MKAATVSGPFGQDHLLELVGAVLRELLLAHGAVGAAEIIRRLGVQDRRARQVEGVVEKVEAGQRPGHDARAVIAAPARDDLLLLRPAEHVVVVPDQLDVGLVGVGTRQAEIDAGHAFRRAVDDHLGERDRGLGAVADIGVVVGEVLRLRGDRVGDLLAAIADIDAVEPGKGVDALLAVDVPDGDAFAAGDDAGRRFAARMRAHMGRGMEEMVAIPGGEFVGLVEHLPVPLSFRLRRGRDI